MNGLVDSRNRFKPSGTVHNFQDLITDQKITKYLIQSRAERQRREARRRDNPNDPPSVPTQRSTQCTHPAEGRPGLSDDDDNNDDDDLDLVSGARACVPATSFTTSLLPSLAAQCKARSSSSSQASQAALVENYYHSGIMSPCGCV